MCANGEEMLGGHFVRFILEGSKRQFLACPFINRPSTELSVSEHSATCFVRRDSSNELLCTSAVDGLFSCRVFEVQP